MAKKLQYWLNSFDMYMSAILLTLMSIVLFSEVALRYFFGISYGLSTEFCGIAFIWMCYFGISYAVGKQNHIVVDVVGHFIPKKILNYINLCSNVVLFAFTCTMGWYSLLLMKSTIEFPFTLAISGISMVVPYAILPFSFILMSVRLVGIIMADIKTIRTATNVRKEA